MKKLLVPLFLIIATDIFSFEEPAILIDPFIGYSFGSIAQVPTIDVRLSYPYKIFGLSIEAGTGIGETDFHFFLGPMVHADFDKIRLLGSVGLALISASSFYTGLGGFFEMNYIFAKNFFVSVGVELNYSFYKNQQEVTGYEAVVPIGFVDDETGTITPVYPPGPRTKPKIENVGSYSNNFLIKPQISIGFQL
jgi:hypothetical protein